MERTVGLRLCDPDCGHDETVHFHTPELASRPGEKVSFCAECVRHEISGPGWFAGIRGALLGAPA